MAGFPHVTLHNILAGPYGAYLTCIQCTPPRTVYAVGTIYLTDGEEVPDIALPPLVSSDSAVVMLRAHCNLQILPGQINMMAAVNFNGRRIHMLQPFIRRIQKSFGILKILPGLPGQIPERNMSVFHQCRRIMHKIQVNPSSLQHSLLINKQVNERGPLGFNLSGVKGPLISF